MYLGLVLLAGCVLGAQCAGLNEEFTWTRINYVWPTPSRFGGGRGYRPYTPPYGGAAAQEEKIMKLPGTDFAFPGDINTDRPKKPTISTEGPQRGGLDLEEDGFKDVNYIYQNNIPMGAHRWQDKLFITVPRRRNGVPSTLNYVSMSSPGKHNVPLTPYPNWDVNQLEAPAADRLVSVYRVAIDACDRMWAIDTGIIELPGNRTDIQPHSIVIFDLKTDKMIKRYQLKDSDLRPATVLALIQVDVTADTCDDAYAYMPDLAGYGLIVYSLKNDDSWRVNHNYFFLEPAAGEFNIGGQRFQWNDGVFSVALSGKKNDGSRDLFFHSMAGTHLYKVSTDLLKNSTMATRSYHGDDFQNLGDRGALAQTSATDLHKGSGVLFLSLVNQNALGCWNTNKAFAQENFDIVQKDDQKMIYPCDLKIYKDDVILLTNNMPVFLYSTLNYDEINFRVWINSVENAVSGTRCGPRRGGRPSYGKY